MSKLLNFLTAGITTGVNTPISLPFNPSEIEFIVSEVVATPENTANHISIGIIDEDGVQVSHGVLSSGVADISRRAESYCLAHYAIVSSATRRVVSASFVSKTSTILTLFFDRADPGYKVDVILRR